MVVTEDELKLARQGAQSAYRSGRGIIDEEDLTQEAYLWIVQNPRKVQGWREKGKHGQNILRNACRQRCLTLIANERRKRSRLEMGDLFYYTQQMIRELIPDMLNEESWTSNGIQDNSELKGPSRPSEGNNRIATICDVSLAFESLKDSDKAILEDLYGDGGVQYGIVALKLGVSERTVRRREERALDKMVEFLGGERPKG
jgi:RNA polymerase sigma factor (sigma-70 family)